MKVLIDITDDEYKGIVQNNPKNFIPIDYCEVIRNGTPLNGTNGEVLMKMFPPSVYFSSDDTYMALLTKDCLVSCSNVDWWNAEYRG